MAIFKTHKFILFKYKKTFVKSCSNLDTRTLITLRLFVTNKNKKV